VHLLHLLHLLLLLLVVVVLLLHHDVVFPLHSPPDCLQRTLLP
jgi:hypothetical protein